MLFICSLQFQKAVVALLSIILSKSETKVVLRVLANRAKSNVILQEVEVEQILSDLGFLSQAESLKLLREHMIGGKGLQVQFQVETLLELLSLRQLATSHLKKEAKIQSSSLKPLVELGFGVQPITGSSLRVSASKFSPSGKAKSGISSVKSASCLLDMQNSKHKDSGKWSPTSPVEGSESRATVHGEMLYWKIAEESEVEHK